MYLHILKIIKELYDENIFYLDGHPKNFIIDIDENKKIEDRIKLIDFDYYYVKFNDKNSFKKKILTNMKNLIDLLIQEPLIPDKIESFEDCKEYIYKSTK